MIVYLVTGYDTILKVFDNKEKAVKYITEDDYASKISGWDIEEWEIE